MANFFKGKKQKGTPEYYAYQYNAARVNILLFGLLTVVNIINLLFTGGDTYFLFSLTIPYFMAYFGGFYCGKLPPEFYEGNMTDYEFFPEGLYIFMLVLSLVILAAYVTTYFLSSKMRVGFLIAALVFSALDTLFMLYIYLGMYGQAIIEIIFHIYIIVYLSYGIYSYYKIKGMPREIFGDATDGDGAEIFRLLPSDLSSDGVIIQAEVYSNRITYRREGAKYIMESGSDEVSVKALGNTAHSLSLTVGGRAVFAGFDGCYYYISLMNAPLYKVKRYGKNNPKKLILINFI